MSLLRSALSTAGKTFVGLIFFMLIFVGLGYLVVLIGEFMTFKVIILSCVAGILVFFSYLFGDILVQEIRSWR